jgi:3'-phosphoadenosine 5'-phosphosulfate sulfotransferase (PAPS reductase)/FAD synthetase
MRELNLAGIEEAERPIFYCSFGKDSSVVLDALKPWLDKTLVVFIDCGGMFPDIVEWADREGAKLPKFFHIHANGDIWQDIREKGWSTDIEIADIGRHSTMMHRTPLARKHKVRPWTQCTMERFWIPGFVFTQMYRPDLFISGEKQMDRPYADDWDTRTHGVPNALRPIFDWTDAEVWEYIDAHDIKMPMTYQSRQDDRRDCYLCMGHDLTVGRIQFLRDNYPELYKKVFYEEGMSELVPVMIDLLQKTLKTWREVQDLLEKDNGN